MAVEQLAVEGLAGLRGQLEFGHLAEDGQVFGLHAGPQQQRRRQQRGQGGTPEKPDHAALLVLFCEAMKPDTASSTSPNAAVTAALSNAPGVALGNPSRPFSREME